MKQSLLVAALVAISSALYVPQLPAAWGNTVNNSFDRREVVEPEALADNVPAASPLNQDKTIALGNANVIEARAPSPIPLQYPHGVDDADRPYNAPAPEKGHLANLLTPAAAPLDEHRGPRVETTLTNIFKLVTSTATVLVHASSTTSTVVVVPTTQFNTVTNTITVTPHAVFEVLPTTVFQTLTTTITELVPTTVVATPSTIVQPVVYTMTETVTVPSPVADVSTKYVPYSVISAVYVPTTIVLHSVTAISETATVTTQDTVTVTVVQPVPTTITESTTATVTTRPRAMVYTTTRLAVHSGTPRPTQ